jgi:DHA2 family multidrug resistance protein-like MFS transporter
VLTFVQGAGMANVIPPATESVMSSLPREKAGVGSAISNTMRQVGGALGVAILGSLLSAIYRGQIADAVAGLPGPARDAASESIAGAHGVGEHIGPAGAPLISAADQAFVSAMHWAAGGSAVVGLIALVVTLAWMPRRAEVLPAVAAVPVTEDKPERVEIPRLVIGTPTLAVEKADPARSSAG